MNLYNQFFYLVNFNFDNTQDSCPSYFVLHVWADTGIKLNEYLIQDLETDSTDKKLAAHLEASIEINSRIKSYARVTSTVYSGEFEEFITHHTNDNHYTRNIICSGLLNTESNDLVKTFETINKIAHQYIVDNLEEISFDYAELETIFFKKINDIYQHMDNFSDTLDKKIQTSHKHSKGFTIPFECREFTTMAPFEFCAPENIQAIKLKNKLDSEFEIGQSTIKKNKI